MSTEANQQKDTPATEGAPEEIQSQEAPKEESSETLETLPEEPTDWGAFDQGFDDDSSIEGDAPTEQKPEAKEEPAPETPPKEEAAPEPAPEKAPEAPAPEQQQETPREREAPALEVDVDTQWANREQSLAEFHQIDDETANAILDDPKEHLPKLLAKVQATAERTIWENLHQVLPDTVQHVLDAKQTEQQVQDAFFDKWPQLREHVAQNPGAEQVIQNLRQTFAAQPGADKLSRDDHIHQVGAAAMVALGIPFGEPQPKNRPPGAQPVKEGQPPKTRQSAGKNASSPGGKQLGAFEEFDAEFGDDSVSSRGATLF